MCQPEKLKVVINQHDSDCTVTLEQIEKAIRHPVSLALPTSSGDLRRAVETGEPISPDKRSEFASQIKNWASTLAPGRGRPSGNQTQICVLELAWRGKKTLED